MLILGPILPVFCQYVSRSCKELFRTITVAQDDLSIWTTILFRLLYGLVLQVNFFPAVLYTYMLNSINYQLYHMKSVCYQRCIWECPDGGRFHVLGHTQGDKKGMGQGLMSSDLVPLMLATKVPDLPFPDLLVTNVYSSPWVKETSSMLKCSPRLSVKSIYLSACAFCIH